MSEGKVQEKINEYTKEINDIKNQGIRSKPGKPDIEIDRLLN